VAPRRAKALLQSDALEKSGHGAVTLSRRQEFPARRPIENPLVFHSSP